MCHIQILSKDILSRWTFPLVPDDNHPGGHVYEHRRGNKYIAKDNTVVLSRYPPPPLPLIHFGVLADTDLFIRFVERAKWGTIPLLDHPRAYQTGQGSSHP